MKIGSHHSEETKKHWSLIRLGRPGVLKGKRNVNLVCRLCKKTFVVLKCQSNRVFCSRSCVGLSNRGNKHNLGRKLSEEHKRKIGFAHTGEKNHKWIKDRTKLVKRQKRGDSAYCYWRKEVWLRDNFKCKIANPDCVGRIEAHHILSWSDFPELRYQINNGITLCHAHHPRKRAEEKRLIPTFLELMSVSK